MIEFHSMIREIKIVERSAGGIENLLFESHTHDDRHGRSTFARHIPDASQPWENNTILMNGEIPIGSGEDPRAFQWRDSPCCTALTFSPDHGFINRLYIAAEQRWITLIPPKSLAPGKNWMPYVVDGTLFFIHGFSPFRVLRARFLSERDNHMLLDIVAEHPMKLPKSRDGFCQFRGGANALALGDRVVGIGHTNTPLPDQPGSIRHRPFLFHYIPGKRVDLFTFPHDFPAQYRIVDPTSLYLRDGRIFLTTSETENEWHLPPQTGRMCLYSINAEDVSHEDSIGFRGRRLHRWTDDQPSQIRRLLGAWRRSAQT